MTRSNVTQRLNLAVATAGRKNPGLLDRPVTPHTVRHTTAMHLLQSGVDITVIALWLGLEDTAPTQDRKSVVSERSVVVRVDLGGRRIIKTNHNNIAEYRILIYKQIRNH